MGYTCTGLDSEDEEVRRASRVSLVVVGQPRCVWCCARRRTTVAQCMPGWAKEVVDTLLCPFARAVSACERVQFVLAYKGADTSVGHNDRAGAGPGKRWRWLRGYKARDCGYGGHSVRFLPGHWL